MMLLTDPWYLPSIGLFSLLMGSFLNVVIFRFPLMLKLQWKKECLLALGEASPETSPTPLLTLALPRSHCPHCSTALSWYDNIPIFSFLWLKGRCRHCQQSISKRYPLVESLTCLLSLITAYHFGPSVLILFGLLFTWSLIVLVIIDYEHLLLPDEITLPMLWLGLIANGFGLFCSPLEAITGAAIGYVSLWSIYWCFKIFTGKEGMGYGDFKLLALLGAWLGVQKLPLLLFMASLIGSLVGLLYLKTTKRDTETPLPFGPYLALAGWIMFLWGTHLNNLYWRLFS